ncbi:MAG TPA: SPW repeat protein [Ramlibacter sp.]|nr:SPW repeat protein [Ramlibacter sp.]
MKHWQDSTNAALGAWLIVSPLALGFQGDWIALANTAIVGVLLAAAALGAIFVPRAWEEWTETALGLWLAVSPWVLGFQVQLARMNALVIGLVVLTLALWALQDHETSPGEKAAH